MNYPGIREKSVKWQILEHLQGKDWTFAGPICRAVHELKGAKEGIIERRCRELWRDDGLLAHRYVRQREDGTWAETDAEHGVVQFRLADCLIPKGYQVYRDAETGVELARVPVYK